MGGTINGPFDNGMAQTITTGNCNMPVYDQWPGTGGYATPSVYYYHTVTPPVECSGDVHVFPCPHCDKCKCGKASVKRDAKKK